MKYHWSLITILSKINLWSWILNLVYHVNTKICPLSQPWTFSLKLFLSFLVHVWSFYLWLQLFYQGHLYCRCLVWQDIHFVFHELLILDAKWSEFCSWAWIGVNVKVENTWILIHVFFSFFKMQRDKNWLCVRNR